MGRPIGSKNKPAQNTTGPVITVAAPATHYDVVFGIRCLRSGPFSGQWELTKLGDGGERLEVIIDATERASVINMVARRIQRIVVGYAGR